MDLDIYNINNDPIQTTVPLDRHFNLLTGVLDLYFITNVYTFYYTISSTYMKMMSKKTTGDKVKFYNLITYANLYLFLSPLPHLHCNELILI